MKEPKPGPLARGIRRSTIVAMAIIVALAIFFYLVRDILVPFVAAAIIAYVCTPLVDWLTRKTRMPRWILAVAVLVAVVAFAGLIGYLGIPPLLDEATRIGGDFQGTITGLLQPLIGDQKFTVLGQSMDAAQIAAHAVDGIRGWFGENGSVLTVAALGFAVFFGAILSVVLLGYFLIDTPHIAKGLFWLIPPQQRSLVHKVWKDLDPVLRRYFLGVGLVVVYASAASYAGLQLFLGLHHALVLAAMTGMFEVIPVAGPAASAVIAGLAAVHQAKNSWDILAYIMYAIALRVSIDEFFGPIVLGRAAYVRPVLVIFCFLSGAVLFGIVGIILAVPVALAIKATLAELYREPEAMLE